MISEFDLLWCISSLGSTRSAAGLVKHSLHSAWLLLPDGNGKGNGVGTKAHRGCGGGPWRWGAAEGPGSVPAEILLALPRSPH